MYLNPSPHLDSIAWEKCCQLTRCHCVNRIFENVVLSDVYLIQTNRMMFGITTLFSFKCFRLLTRLDSRRTYGQNVCSDAATQY